MVARFDAVGFAAQSFRIADGIRNGGRRKT
jgi:hypothetical protein